jgi:hypothetical protein
MVFEKVAKLQQPLEMHLDNDSKPICVQRCFFWPADLEGNLTFEHGRSFSVA